MKKNIIIVVIVIIIAGAAMGGYLWWQQQSTTTPPQPQPPAPAPGTPPPSNGEVDSQIKSLGGPALAGYFLKNGAALGLGTDGQIVSMQNGSVSTLNSATFNEVILEASPSPDGRWILEKWGSGQDPSFSVYDTQNSEWTPLANIALESMDWSPTESKLVYLERVNGRVNLGIMDLNRRSSGSFPRTTATSLNMRDAEITWFKSNEILLSEKPSAKVSGSVWKFDLNTRRLTPVILEQSGLWVEWDKTSGYGIKFDRGTQNRFSLIDRNGAPLVAPSFTTMPDKCSVAAETLYCAVPQEALSGKELPDDYLKKQFYTTDAFYSVNIANGEVTTFFVPTSPVDAVNLKVSGSKLYFINRYDSRLYQLDL